MPESDTVFPLFEKYFKLYTEKVDNSIVPCFLSERAFKEILNDDVLAGFKNKTKIKLGVLKKLRESYFEKIKEQKDTTKEILETADEIQEKKQSNKDISEKNNAEFDFGDYTALLKFVPAEERFIFKAALESYMDKPTFAKLNQLTKYIDRVKAMGSVHQSKAESIPYERPSWLSEKQNKIADSVQLLKNYLIHGERQTGKDTSIAVGKFEKLILHKQQHPLFFMASKIDTAREIMKKILAEDRFAYILPFVCTKTLDYYEFYCKEGGTNKIVLIDTTEAAVKGVTGDLWIDDIDTIIKNHKEEVLMKAISITRSSGNINFIFTSNMGKGAYIELLELWVEPKWAKYVEVMELSRRDVPHIDSEKDEFLWATDVALKGRDAANAELYNIYDVTGDAFDSMSLKEALDNYKYFMEEVEPTIAYEKTILSLDPSGTDHPFGYAVFRYGNDFIWELESGEFKLGYDKETGKFFDPKRINEFLLGLYKKWHCNKFIFENNSGGSLIAMSLHSAGCQTGMSHFGGQENTDSHANKIRLARHFFDSRNIVIKNSDLRGELGRYNPVLSKSKGDAQLKGDVADATLHAIWELVGGIDYLRDKMIDRDLIQNSSPTSFVR